MADPPPPTPSASPPPTLADSLSLAMVSSSDAPLLLLDEDLTVIAASQTFCRAFDIDAGQASGLSLFDLGSGAWNLPKLQAFLRATAAGTIALNGYEIDFKGVGPKLRRLVIKATKLNYADAASARLLVTVSDVTEARFAESVKEDLLRERAVLLQEIRHRVANSLQIIASVLMQTARTVQSEETRAHLHDAHRRIISIAAVQSHLASAGGEDVELRSYFTSLCQSLGASMIRDHHRQSIEVSSDDSIVAADVSMSLGLIVTELVINALKHAFPNERRGKIMVRYAANGPDWIMSVRDNGVGMSRGPSKATAGLGVSIVEALARQLKAEVKTSGAHPGTDVSITHQHVEVGQLPDTASAGQAL